MITNERQYKITRAELATLQEAIKSFDMREAITSTGNKLLAKAQLEALKSESEVISDQLKEYEALKSGTVSSFEAHNLCELPDLLVRARIAKGLSQRQLAERLGLKEQQIQRYEAEKYASASLKRLVEISDSLGLNISESARLEIEGVETASSPENLEPDWVKFPIREMYRRGWFEDFIGNAREAEANAKQLLGDFLKVTGAYPITALHRKHVRSGSILDQYSLLAWQCRILRLGQNEKIKAPFRKSRITKAWMKELVRLSEKDNSPRLAKAFLQDAGIALIVEPYLPQTYLDGAAILLSEERPVIGMTLRFDRLDNFWFVLFHELAHVVLHLGNDDAEFFDDLEAKPDDIEKEADDFASEYLIPNAVWETSVARYVQNPEAVRELAGQLNISPALVAGRIRKESDNYLILNDLIGTGEVRRSFGDVKFGQ